MSGRPKTAEDWGWEVFVAFTAGDMQRGCDIIGKAMAAERAEGRRQMAEEAVRWVDGRMRSYDLSAEEEREVTVAVAHMRDALAEFSP